MQSLHSSWCENIYHLKIINLSSNCVRSDDQSLRHRSCGLQWQYCIEAASSKRQVTWPLGGYNKPSLNQGAIWNDFTCYTWYLFREHLLYLLSASSGYGRHACYQSVQRNTRHTWYLSVQRNNCHTWCLSVQRIHTTQSILLLSYQIVSILPLFQAFFLWKSVYHENRKYLRRSFAFYVLMIKCS